MQLCFSRATRSVAGFGALLLLLASSRRAAAQTYTGPEVKAAVDPSVDILKDQVSFMTVQDRYNALLGYASITARFSPMRFAQDDGTRVHALGSRISTMFGVGYGETEDWGLFAGAWTDVIQMGPAGVDNQAVQGIAFAGASVYGFQLAYDYFIKQEFSGIDGYGNFGASKGAVHYYTYAPGGGRNEDQVGGAKDSFVAYHKSGASLIIVRDTRPTGTTVSEVRAQLQPLKQYVAALGLPMIAVQKLADWKTYGGTADAAQAFQSPGGSGTPYEIEVGSDNLLDAGLRAHAVMRVAPTASFRRAEIADYQDIGRLTLAARAFTFQRDDGIQAGFDSFVRLSITRAGEPREEHVGWPFAVAGSYSFNSPDGSTFVPLPYAHVFGVQIILGVPDIAKPIVPIVRPTPDDGKGGRK